MATVLEFKRPAEPQPTQAKGKKKTWRHPSKEAVRAEVELWIQVAGAPNVYMRYLKLYGRYPSPGQATAMGLKLGLRVRADDGKFYPRKTAAEKQHDKEVRARRKETNRIFNGVFSVQSALQYLVSIDATVNEVIDYCEGDGAYFKDTDAIERDVDKAVDWIQRFAEEWRRRHPVKQDV